MKQYTVKERLSRRDMLKLGGGGLACLASAPRLQGGEKTPLKAGAGRDAKITGLLHNEDCTNFFVYQNFQAGKAGEVIDRYVDVLAGAGVNTLLCNTNSRRTNYRSGVWESFWDGYDPEGPDDQPFLAAVPPGQLKRYRAMIGKMLAVHAEGVDYPARIIQRCRRHGISPWISIRMNDVHNNNNLDHPFHSDLWRREELFRQGHPGYFARALDYAHAEVRNHYLSLIRETLERYDLAGLELDFMREPYLFSKGREQEGRLILTEWLREVRALIKAAASERGHAVKLGARVPSAPETALGLGLDVPRWAKEGLVDLVVAAPRWATLEFAMPFERWRALLGERVTLAGGLEPLYRPYHGYPPRMVTVDEARGAALAVLWGGADTVYLFNFFQNGHPGWDPPVYQRTLKTLSSLEKLSVSPRRHAVTYRDVNSLFAKYRAPLPASGAELEFLMLLGPVPARGWKVELMLEIKLSGTQSSPPEVAINGVKGTLLRSEAATKGRCSVRYHFDRNALSGGKSDSLSINTSADASPCTVYRVEVTVEPRE